MEHHPLSPPRHRRQHVLHDSTDISPSFGMASLRLWIQIVRGTESGDVVRGSGAHRHAHVLCGAV